MKNFITLLLFTLVASNAYGQGLVDVKEINQNEVRMTGNVGLLVPKGTTGTRPAAEDGMFRYNTTLGLFEFYESGSWVNPTDKNEFATNLFRVFDNIDPTIKMAFDISGNTAATTRSYVLQDADGTIPLLESTQSFTGVNTFTQDVLMTGTGQFQMPVGTTLQRSGTPVLGMQRYNTDLTIPEIYDGVAWVPLSAATSIVGPGASTDNAVMLYDGVTGLLAKNSQVIIDADGRISQPGLTFSTYLGVNAGLNDDLTTNNNVGLGYESLRDVTSGAENIAIGYQAGKKLTTGTGSVVLGSQAMENNVTGPKNIAIGYRALQTNFSSTGGNVAVGYLSQRISGTANENTSLGSHTLEDNISGHRNLALGTRAGHHAKGSDNILIGHDSASNIGVTTASQNIFIGSNTGNTVTDGVANILIGYGVDVPLGTTDDYMSLGNTVYADLANDKVGIGVAAPTVELDVLGGGHFSTTLDVDGHANIYTLDTTGDINVGGIGQIDIPSGTTAQRAAIPSPGMIRHNSTLNIFEGHDALGWVPLGGPGVGDIVGPAAATDNAVVRYDSASGKIVQNSGVIIDDLDNVSGVVTLDAAQSIMTSTALSSIPCPNMTEIQRDLITPGTGSCIYNTTTLITQFWNGSSWIDAGSSSILPAWAVGVDYIPGSFVYTAGDFKLWVSNSTHTSGATFPGDIANWDEASDDLNRLAVATDEALVRFNSTSGDDVQDSSVLLDDTGNMTGLTSIASGKITVASTTEASTPCPVMTALERDATTPANGDCVYNSDQSVVNIFDGATWDRVGNVTSTIVSTDNAVPRWDGITGQLIQDSSVVIDDTDNISGIVNLTATGNTTLNTGLTGYAKLTAGLVSAQTGVPQVEVLYDTADEINGPVTEIANAKLMYNHLASAGVMDGCAVTDNLNGTIDIAAGVASLRASADPHSKLYHINVQAQAGLVLVDQAKNYVYYDYNAGAPTFVNSTSESSFNCIDKCLAFVIARDGNSLSILDGKEQNVDGNRKTRRWMLHTQDFWHAQGGTLISELGTRNVAVTAGRFYFMLNEIQHAAFDTSVADTFTYHYKDGTGWTSTAAATQIDNLQYNTLGVGLTTLGNSKYKTDWLYMVHGGTPSLHIVYSQDEYTTLSAAKAAGVPTDLPVFVSATGSIIGKIIYQKSDTAASEVASVFTETFVSSTATVHNGLSGLQGGIADEYYHLPATENGFLTGLDQALDTTDDVSFNSVTIPGGDIQTQLDAKPDPLVKTGHAKKCRTVNAAETSDEYQDCMKYNNNGLKNLFVNPSAEEGSISSDWTCTNAFLLQSTGDAVPSEKSLNNFSLGTLGAGQCTFIFSGTSDVNGLLGRFSGFLKASVAATATVSVEIDTVNVKTVDIGAGAAYEEIEIPFTFGATSVEVIIAYSGAVTIKFDEIFVGAGTVSGSGSGVGGINYVATIDYNMEDTIDNYNLYADAAGSDPVDGTGGVANIVITQSQTGKFLEENNLELAKDAVNRQGEGFSYDFTIDTMLQAQKLRVGFYFDATNANYVDDDMRIAIYDVTNAVLVPVTGQANIKGGVGQFISSFQSAPDSTSYRIIFHIASTNATAYDIYFDNIEVGPQSIKYGSPMTDWVPFTPVIKATTTDPTLSGSFVDARYKRVGGNMEIRVQYNQSSAGSAGSGAYYLVLPGGLSYDSDIDINVPSSLLGNGTMSLGTGTILHTIPKPRSNGVGVLLDNSNTATTEWTNSGVYHFGLTSFRFTINAIIPIQGWSANAQMSEDIGGREIVTTLGLTGTKNIASASPTKVAFDQVILDKTSAADLGNNRINIQESGSYTVKTTLNTGNAAVEDFTVRVYVNGTIEEIEQKRIGASATYLNLESKPLQLAVGDYVEIFVDSSADTSYDIFASLSYFSLIKAASPQTLYETETVAARYTSNSGQNVNSTASLFTYEDLVKDTHNMCSAGVCTIPVSGWYKIRAQFDILASFSTAQLTQIDIRIDGSLHTVTTMHGSGASSYYTPTTGSTVYLTKGQTIEVFAYCAASISATSAGTHNTLSIIRIK